MPASRATKHKIETAIEACQNKGLEIETVEITGGTIVVRSRNPKVDTPSEEATSLNKWTPSS